MNDNTDPNIVVIGGGTGSFTVLSGLKKYTRNITALVNMLDDGGSTGILRDELGVLPPGDVRQCLVALSDSSRLRELFNYRFSEGSFRGHSFGNIFLSTVERMTSSFEEAVSVASNVLNIQGRVLPITTDNSKLTLKRSDGTIIKNQYEIGHLDFEGQMRPNIILDPIAYITPKGLASIMQADLVVIAPGNLYGSLAPALVVEGVGDALASTRAKIAYVCNLVTKPRQTDGFMVHNYANEIERFAGHRVLDYVIFNTDEPAKNLANKYMREGERIVEFDLEVLEQAAYKAIGLPLIAKTPGKYNASDALASERSLIRHNYLMLAKELVRLI